MSAINRETQRNYRATWHDYSAPGTYFITINVAERKRIFGDVVEFPTPHIEHSAFGKLVLRDELPKIQHIYPMVNVWYCLLMPDHIHMILHVKERLPYKTCKKGASERSDSSLFMPRKQLGDIINGFTHGLTKAYWQLVVNTGKSIVEAGYHDIILRNGSMLVNWKKYIEDNPRRLILKRKNRALFITQNNIEIAGILCQTFGNMFLLDFPMKAAVVVHQIELVDGTFERKLEEWKFIGENGGVLVSAAISAKEREVLNYAFHKGYKIIHIRENGFPEIYKPGGKSFDACSQGRLLQICPWSFHRDKKIITRNQCLYLNALAEAIVSGKKMI